MSRCKRIVALIVIGVFLIALRLPFGIRPASAQDAVSYLLAQINTLRASKGLNTLSLNAQLTVAAQSHSNYLASTVYTHPHIERDGSTPQERANRAGYQGRAGENVVGGASASMEWAFKWWVGSPVHYNNMLGNWTEIGVGFADGSGYGRWYTVVFGNPDRAPAPVEGRTAPQASSGGKPNASSGGSGAGPVAAAPRPTQRPRPTSTPTITYTPSITYTPRATFTPTDTPTAPPPSETAIALAISPQAGFAATSPPTQTPLLVAALPNPTLDFPPTGVSSTKIPLYENDAARPAPEADSNPNPLRAILPALIVIQVVVIGGLIARSVRRRKA